MQTFRHRGAKTWESQEHDWRKFSCFTYLHGKSQSSFNKK